MGTAFFIWPTLDYPTYIAVWELTLSGADPWSVHNAYGPGHNLFAIPFLVHPHLPKVLFVLAWQASSWYVLIRLARRECNTRWLLFWLLALPLNPLFWSFGVVYGVNDAFVAALCLAAVVLRQENRPMASAAILAFATLMKIYPIVIMPFMALDGRGVHWKFVAIFAAVVMIGFGLSLYAWGESALTSIIFNSERGSKIMSIFRFLKGESPPLKPWSVNLDHLSVPGMALGGAVVFGVAWKQRLGPVAGSLAGFLVTLLLYKVGHPQFFMFLPLIVGYWVASRPDSLMRPIADISLVTLLTWVATVAALYFATHVHGWLSPDFWGGFNGPWALFRDWVGLPTFVVIAWSLTAILSPTHGR